MLCRFCYAFSYFDVAKFDKDHYMTRKYCHAYITSSVHHMLKECSGLLHPSVHKSNSLECNVTLFTKWKGTTNKSFWRKKRSTTIKCIIHCAYTTLANPKLKFLYNVVWSSYCDKRISLQHEKENFLSDYFLFRKLKTPMLSISFIKSHCYSFREETITIKSAMRGK